MNNILLVDDDEAFKESFLIEAQARGFQLIYKRSFEGLQAVMPKLNSKIVAVILDIKCLISDDQEIEHEGFIGTATKYLDVNFPHFPRIILTGDDDAFDGYRRFTSGEDIYQKTPDGLISLFEKLNYYVQNPRINEIQSMINGGESKVIEFKSSLRFCLKTEQALNTVEHSTFKNIAAFLNTGGGTILIGIDDNGNVIGLDETDFPTFKGKNKEDEFLKHFDNLVQNYFGNAFTGKFDVTFKYLGGKTVALVQINEKASNPVFLKMRDKNGHEKEAFYVRRLASAVELSMREFAIYSREHWG
ncbi:ATP-binding protein [Pedobacter sp. P351]|uniref:AlbA family DNA-binding domain-containing protein n=1 Tax=Pedobacter superstes TaxID=3133441 RepID=UPI00309E472B